MAITDATNPQTNGTTPNTNDLDLSLDLPKINESSTDNSWLQEGQSQIEEKKTQEWFHLHKEEILQDPSVFSKPESAIHENLPANTNADTFQDDVTIIKELQTQDTGEERILEAKKSIPPINTESTKEENQAPTATINLDTLLNEQPTPEKSPIQNSPFDLIAPKGETQNQTTPIPVQETKKNTWVKIGLFVVLFVALGFLTYFIISTMYPMWFWTSNQTSSQIISENTWENMELSWETNIDNQIIAQEMTGDEVHASAWEEVNFQDINDLMENNSTSPTILNQDAIVVKLSNYQELWTKYLSISKAQNDLQSIKYALYLKNKSQTVLNEIIANPNAIDTIANDINTQLAQFEAFLQRLQEKYGDANATPTQDNTDQTINSLTQE